MTTKKGNPYHVKSGKTNGGQFASPTGNSGGLDAAIKRYAKANARRQIAVQEEVAAKRARGNTIDHGRFDKSPKELADLEYNKVAADVKKVNERDGKDLGRMHGQNVSQKVNEDRWQSDNDIAIANSQRKYNPDDQTIKHDAAGLERIQRGEEISQVAGQDQDRMIKAARKAARLLNK